MSDRPTNFAISCATSALVGQRLGPQLADPFEQPRLETCDALLGGRRDLTKELAQPHPPRIEVGLEVSAFAHAHRVELLERGRNGLLDPARERATAPRTASSAFSRMDSACGNLRRSDAPMRPST